MSDINKLWSILKSSSMNDKDMQKAFERAATPNACIELLEDIDTMQNRIDELEKDLYITCIKIVELAGHPDYSFDRKVSSMYEVALEAVKKLKS